DMSREAGELLDAAASVYHLSITLPDATFVPLSAWTWTSYSSRGGFGAPTPLSSLVERDWATRDFLTSFLEKAGVGSAAAIDTAIYEMIGDGRESENLRDELLEVTADPDELVVKQVLTSAPPPAGRLVRPIDRPILEPIPDHSWESRYVLNAATVRLDGKIYILYRAFGDDEISRIGLAWTKDGVNIDGRLDVPIFEPDPDVKSESAGTEDPRVTVIGGELYMLYTAWDHKTAQIAMSSIPVDAFLAHRWDAWERHGLGFPGLNNKDAVLYPEKFNGNYVIYHRIDPNMWISYLDDLACPWPRTGQKIVTGPRPGMMWDGIKIGAGAQPIKTTHGWLNIYHGVDYERSYRLGVLFMDLDDPSNVIYQSPNPILEPELEFEIGAGGNGDYWVPHVVFTCGAVPAVDKDVIGLDDEILVYYGAADTAVGVARGRLRDLVPVLNDLDI
ncbi:MAG: glycosidase, partial [Candidatus Latescibacterota bacterium]